MSNVLPPFNMAFFHPVNGRSDAGLGAVCVFVLEEPSNLSKWS